MNKTYVLFLALLTGIFSAAKGQNAPDSLGTLTLKECIRIAQVSSPVAKSNEYNLIASKWQHQQVHADLLPSLTLSGDAPNYNQNIFQVVQPNGETVFRSRQQSNANASLGIRENILPTGGSISLSSGLTRLGIFGGENTYLWKSTPLQLSLRQPIFQFNSLKWQHRTAPLRYKIAKKKYNQQMEDLAVQVTDGFFNVILAKINRENAQFNVTRNDSIYHISQGRYNIGTIAENELLQTELAFHNAQNALSKSKINYDRALNNFKILLGYPTSVKLSLDMPDTLPDISVNIVKAQQLAMENNSEPLSYKLDKLQADRSLAQAKGSGGFSATLQANFGLNQQSPDFSELYENPQNQKFFTLDFNMPLYNWGKHHAQIQAAKNQERSVANNVLYERRQFMQSVQYRVKNFLQLRDQALLAAESDTIAIRRYQVAENRYRIGKIDLNHLFTAQQDRSSARVGYIQALRSFWTGWYNLRKLTLYDFQDDVPITHTLY